MKKASNKFPGPTPVKRKSILIVEQFEQFILFKIQKAIDPSGNINI